MRYTSDERRRYAFRDWLRQQLLELDFYQRRGDRYLVSEFARYASSLGARVEEVSLGRYLRNENPVLPTPESCRELAKALGRHPTEVLLEAGYLSPEDFYFVPSVGVTAESLREQIQVIDTYTYVPEPIRAQMKKSLHMQLLQMSGVPRQGTRSHTPKSTRSSARSSANRPSTRARDK
ncbi:MAG: hypothetical protein C5B60_02000 [Chloroflexi bacterium]|nr:MAG: hypothetical protein C5B60_02000 [Chloroflexota bacterium]